MPPVSVQIQARQDTKADTDSPAMYNTVVGFRRHAHATELYRLHFPDFTSLLYCTIEPETTTGQVPVVNRQPHIGGDFVAKLPVQDGDALLHPVSFQRDQLEIVSVAPVKQVAGFWFVLHMYIVPDTLLVVKCFLGRPQ